MEKLWEDRGFSTQWLTCTGSECEETSSWGGEGADADGFDFMCHPPPPHPPFRLRTLNTWSPEKSSVGEAVGVEPG